jgi:Glycosyltransferase
MSGDTIQHVYIIGVKSIGLYGGYESFVMNLLQEHSGNSKFMYHIANKANGQGCMDLSRIPGAESINDTEFEYYGAHCFMVPIPEWAGSAQAIIYDLRALKWVCKHIRANNIQHPKVYILASRIGPFERKYAKKIRKAGGQLLQNPDGHENWRRKWSAPIRAYWKFSEKYAVKHADLVVCDSKNIESYIQEEYKKYSPKTVFIPYGSDTSVSGVPDDDPQYVKWLADHDLKDGKFIISVGRFVQENNYDIMIREFMKSKTDLDYAIITTENSEFAAALQKELNYKSDPRIKFVGTVYDARLLAKIREKAAAYIHGHEVGGTNPSLLESMGKTNVNLLYDVCFNREVAGEAALYWTKDEGSLEKVLNSLSSIDAKDFGMRAKERMKEAYNWKSIADDYEDVFLM